MKKDSRTVPYRLDFFFFPGDRCLCLEIIYLLGTVDFDCLSLRKILFFLPRKIKQTIVLKTHGR